MTGAAEDRTEFVADQFLDPFSGGTEVFTGIEFLGIEGHGLTDAGGHGEAEVGIDIDLGATGAAGDFDIGFGDAGGVGAEVTAELVDFGDQIFGDGGGAVEDEGIIAETGFEEGLFDGAEAFDIEVLFALEFVGTMAIADGDGEGIDAGLADEAKGFVGVGVMAVGGIAAALLAFIELGTDQVTEFAFDDGAMFMSVIDDLTAGIDIFGERLVGSVDHDGREAVVDALLAQFEGITVVEMDGDGDGGDGDGGFDQFTEVHGMGVGAGAAGNLEDDGGFFLFAGFDDGLDEFHIVHVEGTDGVFAFEGLGEELLGGGQWHRSNTGVGWIVPGMRWGRLDIGIAIAVVRDGRHEKMRVSREGGEV